MFALANGLVVGRGVKSSGAIIGVKTSEISEASSTSLDTVTSTGMNLLPSSTTLSLSLSLKPRANKEQELRNLHDLNNFFYQCSPV